jgi:bacillithiol biosynthesis cysteine-adding enzyme BshC
MEPLCVRQTSIPGTTKLFGDFLYDFDKVSRFYHKHFSDSADWHKAAKEIEYPDERRRRLVEALWEQNGDSPSLTKLGRPGTVAVVTGQQVGLFGGPAYSLFKALTAVKLAGQLEELGIPAVPIFWLATEDHDLAEVDHAWIFNEHASIKKISLSTTATTGGPVGDVKLNGIPWADLRRALGELPFANEIVAQLEASYCPGATMGSAFQTFFRGLVKDLGLLFVDPLVPANRAITAPFLASAVQHIDQVVPALRRRDEDLAGAGYHAQVHVEQDTSLLFLIQDGKRIALRYKDGRFAAKDHSYSADELREKSLQLSPNALLRPVMQDYLLPTIAYVGGPSEIAYMAQAEVLYRALLGRMPIIFPRNSYTLLDRKSAKLIQHYHLTPPQLLGPQELIESRIAANLVPTEMLEEFRTVRSAVDGALAKFQSHLTGFDPTLQNSAQKSATKMRYQLEKLSRKTAKEAMRRDAQATRSAAYLTNTVYPHRHLQERFYSIVPFLAKYGTGLPERLLNETQLVCPDHIVRTL